MERIYTSGETIELVFEFFDNDNDPIDVTNIKLKDFDEAYVQVGETVAITNDSKIGTGKYKIKYVIPNGEGILYLQCSANNGSYEDIKRLEIKRTFYIEKSVVELTVGINTYISLADANTYFASRLSSDGWDFASDTNKSKALIKATKSIDRLRLKGVKQVYSQTLQFPRYILTLSNSRRNIDNLQIIETAEIPKIVKEAVCEEAIALLENISKPNTRITLQRQGVKSFKIGDLSEDYGKGVSDSDNSTKLISQEAKEMMAYYITNSVRIV